MDSLQENVGQGTEAVYKTKIVEFLGRSVPIILQNDNGPCPLLAICNVLLLRNILKLSLDTVEIGSSKLLALVAERLLDSNSNMQSEDEEFARNQRQNISDAITLLPHLATGLDVNVQFRNIHDFEFTRECTVFDLLDIGLVHGWLCDPQDELTSKVIGNKSYNSLVEKLVDAGDVTAATTATLGVPSSNEVLLNTESFNELQKLNVADIERQRKGDAEETYELLQALKISMGSNNHLSSQLAEDFDQGNDTQKNENKVLSTHEENSATQKDENKVLSTHEENSATKAYKEESKFLACKDEDAPLPTSLATEQPHHSDNNDAVSIQKIESTSVVKEKSTLDNLPLVYDEKSVVLPVHNLEKPFEVHRTSDRDVSLAEPFVKREGREENAEHANPDYQPLLSTTVSKLDAGASENSCLKSSEPLSEGEPEVGTSQLEDRKAIDEYRINVDGCPQEIPLDQEGAIIHNFLQTHANQLTYYGLFCLQEGLKERELCVFFRNNHFNTMFKYKGQLYLLVTDQGYINQPDIVWEKLDEVYGDTVFMTGTFLPFQAGEAGNSSWNERGAIADTENPSSRNVEAGIDSNADLQLAMYLQQQEFEQQKNSRSASSASTPGPARPRPHPERADGSRLVTGPRKSSYSSNQDQKSKCRIM